MARRRRQKAQRVGSDEFPVAFRERIETLLGAESEEFFTAIEREVTGLRVNTLRASAADARAMIPFPLEPLDFPPEGFTIPADVRPGKHPLHATGLYYLQDPAAMVVGALAAPRPGDRVADLSAAPGGKATHLAAAMGDEGFLLANDVHPARARDLAGNLERCGVRNAAVSVEPLARLASHFGAWFDHVLLDAPCSGEAMFCESAAARASWSPAAVLGCAQRQEDLLAHAASMVRPGGRLVYSTCTFSPEEDEQVIAGFLKEHGDFDLEATPAVPGAEPGRAEWVDAPLREPTLSRTVRLWPHRFPGAGHFIAVLRRVGGEESRLGAAAARPPSAGEMELISRFSEDVLTSDLDSGTLSVRGDELFAIPAAAPELDGLRMLRPGWWLGTLRPGRLEPVHALAMGLRDTQPQRTLELGDDAAAIESYLRGETLRSDGPSGWLLVTTRGLPLGWGKRVGTVVKNHLPKGLRWL